MSTFRRGTAAEPARNRPAARRIQDQKPHAQRIPGGIAQAEAHESEARFSAVFRTSPVERKTWMRPGSQAVRAMAGQDSLESFEWRQENGSRPQFSYAPGSEGIPGR